MGTVILKADGTIDRVLTSPDPTLRLECTVWASDDQRLACAGSDAKDPSRIGIYTVRASDGGDLQRLTSPRDRLRDWPRDYSPDGEQLLFSRTDANGVGPLMLVGVAGGAAREVAVWFADSARFAPDGTAFLVPQGGDQLLVLGLDGSLIDAIRAESVSGPLWSPDGEWIAYAEGWPSADIYAVRRDGTDRWQVTDTAANEVLADWVP
jgi:Tol biopolymer transport system component